MARALRVRRPGGRYPVAGRGHDRKAIFRRNSAPALPPPAAPHPAVKIPKGFCPPAQRWRPSAYLGSSSHNPHQPQPGLWPMPPPPGFASANGALPPQPSANGLGIVTHKRQALKWANQTMSPLRRAALRSPPPPHETLPLPHRHRKQTNCLCPMQIGWSAPKFPTNVAPESSAGSAA